MAEAHTTSKQCTICKQVLTLELFPKNKESKHGRRGQCKSCLNAMARKRYTDNIDREREKQKTYSRTYREKHRERLLARARALYQKNRVKQVEKAALYRAQNPDAAKKARLDYYYRNRDYCIQQNKLYLEKNREAYLARSRAYYIANAERKRQYSREWGRDNPEKVAKNCGKRRAALLQRFPQWADEVEISRVYALRQTMSDYFKTDFHVDHIIPLRGRKVSGLHVHNNLQILTAEQNLSKGNKFKCK